jgi:hypothetical protein
MRVNRYAKFWRSCSLGRRIAACRNLLKDVGIITDVESVVVYSRVIMTQIDTDQKVEWWPKQSLVERLDMCIELLQQYELLTVAEALRAQERLAKAVQE